MAKCWELRGCDDEMQAECPHSAVFKDNCPTKCAFATCTRPTHEVTSDPELIFRVDVDRTAVIRDGCLYCRFYLENGPRLTTAE